MQRIRYIAIVGVAVVISTVALGGEYWNVDISGVGSARGTVQQGGNAYFVLYTSTPLSYEGCGGPDGGGTNYTVLSPYENASDLAVNNAATTAMLAGKKVKLFTSGCYMGFPKAARLDVSK